MPVLYTLEAGQVSVSGGESLPSIAQGDVAICLENRYRSTRTCGKPSRLMKETDPYFRLPRRTLLQRARSFSRS